MFSKYKTHDSVVSKKKLIVITKKYKQNLYVSFEKTELIKMADINAVIIIFLFNEIETDFINDTIIYLISQTY